MDLNKEIKLGDLFRRGKGPAAEDASAEVKPPKEKKERKSFSFSRAGKEPKAPKAPREPKASKGKETVSPQAAPPPPAVPLMRAFDLMPKESERVKSRSGTSPQLVKVALALVAIMVLAGLAGAYMMMDARAKEKQSQADDLRVQLAEVTAAAAADEAPDATTITVEGQARTAALSDALAARVAWDRILREFSLVLPDGVWLTTLGTSSAVSADPAAATAGGESTFSINGMAESHEDVALLLSRLEVIPEFSSVQLESSGKAAATAEEGSTAPATDTLSFVILATIAPEGVPSS